MMDANDVLKIYNSITKKKSPANGKYSGRYRIQKFHCSKTDYDLLQSYLDNNCEMKSKLFSVLIKEFIELHNKFRLK